MLMTVWMPKDTVNSEVYIKTPRCHSAVNMDPWTSSTWRKPWDKYHTPNKLTKDKLSRFTQQKTHKGISLNKTAGRQGWSKRSNWSPRPNKDEQPKSLWPDVRPQHFSHLQDNRSSTRLEKKKPAQAQGKEQGRQPPLTYMILL